MQPLKLLNNVQKARLLHNLQNEEMPGFLAYLKEQAGIILNQKEEMRANWTDQMFNVELWFELANEVQRKLVKYDHDFRKNGHLFADQLFDGYTAIFTIHALNQYVASGRYEDVHFEHAVNLLFT